MQHLFTRHLDRQTVEDIAIEFITFQKVSGIKFESNNDINYGCFSASIKDISAVSFSIQYGWCVVFEPEFVLPLTNPEYIREYLVNLIEVSSRIDIVSIWECNSGTGMAVEIANFDFSIIKSICNFPVLIPRIGNKRENIIGVAVRKDGREIKIEFKRDGIQMPVLN